ncbi:YdeI/OmpD-associated family protein [Aquimarina algiphila]|uniref:Bacteriocin-protection protein n=1 Tax=Aquimarina algiphila TaxID=2047982 RepID=A0A554VFQ0_9FLAO|nr:YdeI/OmpD-associated family protein [Aquimarina algiphila]TSE06092.1 hypothetical protein FOF46_20805 [Aquimarina algiphila]
MKNFEKVYFVDRNEWRNWLQKNFRKADEIWLIYPKKSSGKPRILYNDAVEEALCFGWIDSIVKKVDDEHTAQRFTPRKANSIYSQPNRERLYWLTQQKMLHPSIQEISKKILQEDFVFPTDIMEKIKKNNIAWSNYQKLSISYRRIRIAYIDSARKRPEEFEKRLTNFINKTSQGKLIAGFGGIKKYY